VKVFWENYKKLGESQNIWFYILAITKDMSKDPIFKTIIDEPGNVSDTCI
jgi:hypothetical protein